MVLRRLEGILVPISAEKDKLALVLPRWGLCLAVDAHAAVRYDIHHP